MTFWVDLLTLNLETYYDLLRARTPYLQTSETFCRHPLVMLCQHMNSNYVVLVLGVFFWGLLEPECWKMSAICKWYSRFHNHPGAPWWTPCIGSLAFVLQLYRSRLVFKISNPTDLLEFQGKFKTQTNRIFLSALVVDGFWILWALGLVATSSKRKWASLGTVGTGTFLANCCAICILMYI